MKKKYVYISIIVILLLLLAGAVWYILYGQPTEKPSLPADTNAVAYEVDSSFCVVIPETVDAFNGFQLSASYMRITDAEQVNVSVNSENSILMTNDEGDTFDLMLSLNDRDHVVEFIKNQTTSDFIVTGQPVGGDMPAAGSYTGTVEFVVNLGVKTPQY